MTEKMQVYKCMKCGNVVEITSAADGQLVCCDEPMRQLKENTVDAALEKHVPVASASAAGGTLVKVGSVAHPMEPDHFIEWIEVINGDYINRKYLHPGDAPEAEFYVPFSGKLVVREYCNKHGLWKK